MGRRHNQYRNRRTRSLAGEDDDFTDKKKVVKIMESMGYWCKTNQYLMVHRYMETDSGRLYDLLDAVHTNMLGEWKLAARPDVTVYDDAGKLVLIAEVDGDVHKGDLDERPLYTELEIPAIIINKRYLEQEGISWESWVRQHMEAIRRSD